MGELWSPEYDVINYYKNRANFFTRFLCWLLWHAWYELPVLKNDPPARICKRCAKVQHLQFHYDCTVEWKDGLY